MDDRILNKIKMCLALAKSASNEHEAAAAMRSAQALMRKHHISVNDVDLSFVSEFNLLIDNSHIVNYQACLFRLIEKAFGVKSIFKRAVFSSSSINFIGITPQPELASYCYEVLWERLKFDRSSYVKAQPKQCKRITKTARGDRFAEGWVWGVSQAVSEFAASEKELELITTYIGKHYPDLGTGKPMVRGKKANTKDSAYDGFKAGKRQSIHRPINGHSQLKLTSRG